MGGGTKPAVLSLFTGAGGLDLGLEAAGFETVCSVELNSVCRRTLKWNRPQWNLLDEADVISAAGHLSPQDFDLSQGDLDLIAGGPPCQPFSKASQWSPKGRRGMKDDRAETVVAMLDLVEAFLPRVLLIENVAGFLRGQVSAKSFIDDRLATINHTNGVDYQLVATVVNSADFGVPQNRHRVIGIALRDNLDLSLPVPTHEAHPLTAWDALHDAPEEDDLPDPQGYWSGLLPAVPEGQNYQYLTKRGGGQEVFGYRTRYWSFLLKLARNQPSWTLPASPGPATGPFHWDNRPLSVREMLRLQSFPDDWALEGTHREQVKQAGNATPPLLAEVFGRQILRALTSANLPDQPTLLRNRAAEPPPTATPPQPVPPEYLDHVGAKPEHPGTGLGPGRMTA
ncbi:DNA cytosine methyltransferase [Kribbella speibonae]|uniref:Cytosine-specific methyltransferase n=1 Tax=Kribbella speibonae TaxID=1572660 RepID=A0ABY2A0I3_9ACTN|nr:DNA cytosine methyltransferase [Kribbella speibonae]TCC20091.1 DNA cytosine methyltransferase [Kribbella speibonae]